jgi:hypothetical protein
MTRFTRAIAFFASAEFENGAGLYIPGCSNCPTLTNGESRLCSFGILGFLAELLTSSRDFLASLKIDKYRFMATRAANGEVVLR